MLAMRAAINQGPLTEKPRHRRRSEPKIRVETGVVVGVTPGLTISKLSVLYGASGAVVKIRIDETAGNKWRRCFTRHQRGVCGVWRCVRRSRRNRDAGTAFPRVENVARAGREEEETRRRSRSSPLTLSAFRSSGGGRCHAGGGGVTFRSLRGIDSRGRNFPWKNQRTASSV